MSELKGLRDDVYRRPLATALLRLGLGAGWRCVDVGAGGGDVSVALAEMVGRDGRIYAVEPLGSIEDDPNLTNKRFPGNPTKSYRSRNPIRVVAEVKDWQGHSAERLQEMHHHLENLRRLGVEAIEE